MQTEIEAKFADIEIEAIRKKLQDCGAKLIHPMRLMRRALIEEAHMQKNNGFIRIRDEGDKVTLTYKEHRKNELHGAKEIEVVVSSFEDTVSLFQQAGWAYKTFQESKRETWELDDNEIVIDIWPWLDPFIEIEGPSEDSLKSGAKKLGLDWREAIFGSVDILYNRKFPHMSNRGIIDIKDARLDSAVPSEFLK